MAIQNADRDNFRKLIEEDFVIVDFYGESCVPCKMFARILEDLDAEIPFLNIVKLNVTENAELAREYHVMGVPMGTIGTADRKGEAYEDCYGGQRL